MCINIYSILSIVENLLFRRSQQVERGMEKASQTDPESQITEKSKEKQAETSPKSSL
jgi:hypothetical protein